MNEIQQFASKKIYLKMVYVKWRPVCSGVNVFEMSRSEQNGHHSFSRRHFKCIFISLNSTLLFLSIMWSSRAYWQYVIIDAGNDLAPNRRQAIAWTSDGLVLRCIYGTWFSSMYQGWGRVGSVPRYHINHAPAFYRARWLAKVTWHV